MAIESVTIGTLSLTSTDASGAQWGALKVEGWGSPGGTLVPVQKARADGAWGGDSFFKARSIAISGETVITGTDSTAAQDALIAAVSLAPTVLTVVESGIPRTAVVRRDGDVMVSWPTGSQRLFQWSIQLVALDSRKFGTVLTGSTGLPSSSGGLTYPYTYPYTYSTVSVSGQIPLFNPGNAVGPVTLRIDGPVTGPVITHVGSSSALAFSSSMVIAAGEFMTVDMEKHTTLAQGQSSRDGYVTSRGWSGFDPGANLWSFAATSGTGTLTVNATPAWS